MFLIQLTGSQIPVFVKGGPSLKYARHSRQNALGNVGYMNKGRMHVPRTINVCNTVSESRGKSNNREAKVVYLDVIEHELM